MKLSCKNGVKLKYFEKTLSKKFFSTRQLKWIQCGEILLSLGTERCAAVYYKSHKDRSVKKYSVTAKFCGCEPWSITLRQQYRLGVC
jgi:hypothetical protein